MRLRLMALTLAVLFLFVLFGCSKSSNPAGDNTAANPDSTNATQSAAPAEAPKPLVVSAGRTLTVKLGQALGSKLSQAGQSFTGSLASPVEVAGATAIPAGAEVTGTVVDAKPLGRFAGGAVLTLKLTAIRIHGTHHQISTEAFTRTAKGKGKRTGVMAGGGAAVGALIGGLAGGGKGAAIGAVAGGGAGTAGAAYTGNNDIVLPAESAVTFKLTDSIEVRR